MKQIKQLTQEQAIALCDLKFYEGMSVRDIAVFQMQQDRLCMPFNVFQNAMIECLGRKVYTHEFASSNLDNLMTELLGSQPAPTLEEIMNLIPEEKRINIV